MIRCNTGIKKTAHNRNKLLLVNPLIYCSLNFQTKSIHHFIKIDLFLNSHPGQLKRKSCIDIADLQCKRHLLCKGFHNTAAELVC